MLRRAGIFFKKVNTRFNHHRIDRGRFELPLLACQARFNPILFDCLYTKEVNPSKERYSIMPV